MSERKFDRIRRLHLDTLSPTATKSEKTLASLSMRLFKYPLYSTRVNISQIKDITTKVVIIAYISGMENVNKRKASKFASLDEALVYDEAFYVGLWEMLCEWHAPEGALMEQVPPVSEQRLSLLKHEPDIIQYNVRDMCDEYLSWCMFNDQPLKSRNKVSILFNLPSQWVAQHYMKVATDNRVLPTDKLLMLMFGLFKLDYLAKPAPKRDYWITLAYLTWEKLHDGIRDDLAFAQVQRAKYNKQDSGNY